MDPVKKDKIFHRQKGETFRPCTSSIPHMEVRSMRSPILLFTIGTILFVVGCQPTAAKEIPSTPAQRVPTQGDVSQMTPSFSSPSDGGIESLLKKAKQDLAQRFSIPESEINVIETKSVTWPDSSLGCPQEGFVYSQVLTPGYLIVLEYASNRYEYHAGKSADVLYCSNPQPPVPNDNT